MDTNGKPIPLRCVLMTISMGVLLVLLCAGPACTHKNRESKLQEASVTVLPSLGIPVLTPPKERDSTSDVTDKKRPPWPPSYTWLMFSDHAAKTKKKRPEESLRQRHSGPIGAPAPPKHQNHPVNYVLREKKLSQFLQMLSDALLRRKDVEKTSDYKCAPTIPPAKVAFTCKTNSDIHVEPGEPRELQLYEMSHLDGSFYRGEGLNLTSGRYTAPYTGLYAFFARLHIDFQKYKNEGVEGFVRMQLCILSLCQDNLSLEHVLYRANEVTATITLNGVLYIQAGQYVSLFLENKMDSWTVTVVKGSDFSGVLLGQ